MRKLAFVISVLLFYVVPIALNGANKDSLANILTSIPADSHKVEVYHLLVEELKDSNQQQAQSYAKAALELAEKLNFQKGVVLSLQQLGQVKEAERDFDQALGNI